MGGYSWVLFLLCGVFILSIGIALFSKGFWIGLTGACSLFLAGAFALRYDVQLNSVLSLMDAYNTLISFLIILVAGSAIFGTMAGQGQKLKFYFSKKMDLFAKIGVIVALLIASVLLVQLANKIQVKNGADIPVIGKTTKSPKAKTGLVQSLTQFDGKIEAVNHSAKRWFSIPLQISLVLTFYLWALTGAWAAFDVPKRSNIAKPIIWNLLFVLVFPLGLLLGLIVPVFIVDALIPPILFLVPALIYVKIRNQNVPQEEKVLTKEHITLLLRNFLKSKKKKKGGAEPIMTTIDLFGYDKDLPKADIKARTEAVRILPGYTPFTAIVNNALLRRATALQISNLSGQITLKYFIDGFWHPAVFFKRPLSEQETENLFAAMRTILGGNPEEKRPRQTGMFYIEYDKRKGKKKKMLARLLIQAKGTGFEVLIQFERLSVRFGSFEKMRVGSKRAEQLKQILMTEKGVVVFAAAPGQGLRTMTDVALCETDRFTRDYSAVEDIRHPYMFIENVVLYTYDSTSGQSPISILPDVFFKEPRVLVLRDMINKESFTLCCEEIQNERLIITTMRAKTSAQAIMALLKTGVDPKLLADSITAVVSQRLIRTLCPTCKEEITASDEMCRRLGIPPGRVKSFFRRRVRPAVEPGKRDNYVPCKDCMEIGYKGQAGLYDVIMINDEIRQIMTTHPSEEAIRRAAMKAGGGSFTADGVRMVAEGLTSLDELGRVMKE